MHRTITARHDRFILKHPFRIARGEKTAADVITVEITSDGLTGRGEGVPYARYGETVDAALAQLGALRPALQDGLDRAELLAAMPPGAARNAADCALWDLEAKQNGISVAHTLNAPPLKAVASALTIVIDTPDAMAKAAAAAAHAPLLKIKVDDTDPAAMIRAVKAAAPDAALIVDPNESWTEEIVRMVMPVLTDCGVDVLEQPVPAGSDGWLENYASPVTICADESVHTASDLGLIAARYGAVNVKLDKAGGLTAALELAAAARALGLKLMSGCMVCSSLGIAPALHIARMADWADLDGPLWLREDYPGGVKDANGYLLPPQQGFWG